MRKRLLKLLSSPLVAASGTGLLLAAALPPFNLAPLAWLALAPLFAAGRHRSALESAGLGMVAGVVCGVVHVGYHPSFPAMWGGFIPFFWLALLLGGVSSVATLARARLSGAAWVLWVAAAGVSAEFATTLLPLPLNLALTQHRSGLLLALASVTGAWGISFLLWAGGAALAEARRRPARLALAGAALVLSLLPTPGLSGPTVRVAAIQDHLGGDAYGIAPTAPDAELPDQAALTRSAARDGARLVVWSERCLGYSFTPGNADDVTRRLAREVGTTIVPGYMAREGGRSYNCAAWVSPEGEIRGVHHKLYPFMDEARTVTPGKAARAVETELGRAGMLICFDTCYPRPTRELVRGGARLIAVPTIDPPVARAVLHFLHAAVTPLRAAEHGVPLVRADPNGLSQVVDRDGRVVAEAPLWQAVALVGEVHLGDGRGTLYTRFGDWFAWLCLAALALVFRLQRRSAKKVADPLSRPFTG